MKVGGESKLRSHMNTERKTPFYIAIMLAIGIAANIAHAIEPQGNSLGPSTRFSSEIEFKVEQNDNFYRTNSNEVDAFGFLLLPEMSISYSPSHGKYTFGYVGELGEFDTGAQDDYFDHKFFTSGLFKPLLQHRFSYDGNFRKDHDSFGLDRTQGSQRISNQNLDEWTQFDGGLKYTYGSEQARLNWYLRAEGLDKKYETNRSNALGGTRFLDRTEKGLGTGLTFILAPRTYLVADLSHKAIEYDVDSTPSFDGTLTKALVGIKWLATAKTTGQVQVGSYSRDFDNSLRKDNDGLSWSARVTWSPKTYSHFKLETGQRALEHVLLGEDFIDYKFYKVGWRQDWTVRVHTDVEIGFYDSEFSGTNRTDDRLVFDASIDYELSTRYLLSLGTTLDERDSSNNLFDFDQTKIYLSLKTVF